MRILTLLPDASRRVLEHAVGTGHTVVPERSTPAAVAMIRERQFDVLVFDPGTLGDDEFTQLIPVLRQKAVPVLLFTTLTAANARRIVQAADAGAHELLLHDAEDVSVLLAHALTAIEPSAPALLLNRVARSFYRFPEGLQAASIRLFGGGPLPRWVNDLARSSGLARRSVDRWMQRAGIDGAASLLDAARLARVWRPATEDKLSTAAVAKMCGYARPRLLLAHAKRMVGVAPSDFGDVLTRQQFAERLARKLKRH
ncbi:MAG: hypothetical protein ACHQQ3_03705 [Gemmatimonadales bacterium]